MSRAEDLNRYVELCEWTRELSSPQVEGIRSAAEFRTRFERSFSRINELIRVSAEILETTLFPLLEKETLLTEEETEDLFAFTARLLDAVNIECVDVPLRERVIDRLLEDAEAKQDTALILRALDARVETCYFMMSSVSRITDVLDVFTHYRDKGMEAAKRILYYLEPERFAALPDYASKEIVLVNSRYINGLYESAFRPDPVELLQENLNNMKRALLLADDPFFIDQASKYNWKNHAYRSLQGIAFMTDYMNEAGCPDDMLQEINRHTRQMVALWKRDKVTYGALCAAETLYQSMYRNAYLAGEMTVERFREEIVKMIDAADPEDFTHDGNMSIIFAQTEYMLTLDKENLTGEEKRNVTRFYKNLVKYVHRMPKVGSMTFLLVYLNHALRAFIEFEGGPVWSDLLMNLLAAIHPQVYLHSMGTAEIARILTRRLFLRKAEQFAHVPGYPDGEKVAEYAYQAGRLHDIGKMMVAERILTYSRERFPEEEEIYMAGPEIGARLLSMFESTRPYAEAVRTHHFDYDRKDAFSRLHDDSTFREETAQVSHVLRLANDMQWLTRVIRFSRIPRVDYDGFLEQARAGSGTKYAPCVVELLNDAEVKEELREVLGEESLYRGIYRLLKNASSQETD